MNDNPFWAYGTDADFVDNPQALAWQDAICALVPVNGGGIRVKHEPAPIIDNIGAFLQRGDPIKPSLARIVGRVLAGEPFCSLPQNLLLPEQFNDEGVVIWNANKPPTQATIEAFMFRVADGKVVRISRGKPFEPFRAGAVWRAAELARAGIAAGKPRSLAIADAASTPNAKLNSGQIPSKRNLLPPIKFQRFP
jgi:hypothetical protein